MRRVEVFVHAISNSPEALRTVYDLYIFRTGRASLGQQEWNDMVRSALKQSIAYPRATVHHWFKCESQFGLHADFLQNGRCKGLSILKMLLHGKPQESIDYTKYRETKEIIPFSELLGVVPSLSDLWFQRTYQSLLSGRRPSSAKDRIDQIIFRSLVNCFQEELQAWYNLPKVLEHTAPHLRSVSSAQYTFAMNALQEALDFFKCALPQHERLILDFSLSSAESGHSVSVIQEKGEFFLWDCNGYSFQSRDVSKFTEKFFRLVKRTYPEKEDNSDPVNTLTLSIEGVNSIDGALNRPIQLDARYELPSQLPINVDFVLEREDNAVTGACKVKLDNTLFLPLLTCFPPHYSRDALTPFLINTLFWAANVSSPIGPQCASKENVLAMQQNKAWDAFGIAIFKDFALVNVFQAVGRFCQKSFNLPLPKHRREVYALCFERIAVFLSRCSRPIKRWKIL